MQPACCSVAVRVSAWHAGQCLSPSSLAIRSKLAARCAVRRQKYSGVV